MSLLSLAALSAPLTVAADDSVKWQDLIHLSYEWATYNGDYSGKRFSPLTQVNRATVHNLTLAWVVQLQSAAIKSTPLEVNGLLYLTTPDNVWSIDARTGGVIWHYNRPSVGDHVGNRGVGILNDSLYFTTPDCHLVSLNAKDGSERWNIELADPKSGYFATMAPLIVRNHVIVGVSGDVTDIPGFLESIEPATGKVQWRWNTEPRPGEPGSETWPPATDAMLHGGGMTWMTGTYDPELNQLYWGTGNPNPVLSGDIRRGENWYTCSIVSLNPDTGKLNWHFQATPHDTHDWDAVQTPILMDDEKNGAHRRLLLQANRNGYFFVLDRVNGHSILTAPFDRTNWAQGIDSRGEPMPNASKEPRPDGTLVSPGAVGATNWMAPSFDPMTGLLYVTVRHLWSVFYMTADDKPEGWAGRDRTLSASSSLRAIDYRTGQVRWDRDLGEGLAAAGNLTTSGNLLFTGDTSNNFIALDPANGEILWHANLGARIQSGPMTYALDDKQYLLMSAGTVLFAWCIAK